MSKLHHHPGRQRYRRILKAGGIHPASEKLADQKPYGTSQAGYFHLPKRHLPLLPHFVSKGLHHGKKILQEPLVQPLFLLRR
jgi:hypothetical protein